MLVAALAGLVGMVAQAAAGPEQVAALNCTGVQTAWREEGGARQSLAWSRQYTLYLKSKRYCEARCRPDATLDESVTSRLVLGDADYKSGSAPLTYQDATGAIAGEQVVSFGQLVSIGPKSVAHLKTTGTCTLQAGAAKPSVPSDPPTPQGVITVGTVGSGSGSGGRAPSN